MILLTGVDYPNRGVPNSKQESVDTKRTDFLPCICSFILLSIHSWHLAISFLILAFASNIIKVMTTSIQSISCLLKLEDPQPRFCQVRESLGIQQKHFTRAIDSIDELIMFWCFRQAPRSQVPESLNNTGTASWICAGGSNVQRSVPVEAWHQTTSPIDHPSLSSFSRARGLRTKLQLS